MFELFLPILLFKYFYCTIFPFSTKIRSHLYLYTKSFISFYTILHLL